MNYPTQLNIKKFNWYIYNEFVIFILDVSSDHFRYIICGKKLQPIISGVNIFNWPGSYLLPFSLSERSNYLKECIEFSSEYHYYFYYLINNKYEASI